MPLWSMHAKTPLTGKSNESENVRADMAPDVPRRMRRLRKNETIRNMVRETQLTTADLIYPMFVQAGIDTANPIVSMPGIFHYPLDAFEHALDEVAELGISSILLFGVPEHKDEHGSEAWSEAGIVQQAIQRAKRRHPQLYIIGDVCLCAYTDHGHCGVVHEGEVLNDESVKLLAKVAVSQAEAGADMVAPSDMMDGRVHAIRFALDQAGFTNTSIMAYSAKFASAFYGPFREAADSAPQFGDRRSYQMDPANGDEALREVRIDAEEGADVLMVKPAMSYGDIIYRAKQATGMPLAAYSVSGEYAMIKAAAAEGLIDEQQIVMESLTGMKRAGADLLITYHAKDLARWLKEQ